MGYKMTVAAIAEISHSYTGETDKYYYEELDWATDENGEVDDRMLLKWDREGEQKIRVIQGIYDQAPKYWSVLQYFLKPMSKTEVAEVFEQNDLRIKYRSMGHKVLSDDGMSAFQKFVRLVSYKICPF